MKHAESKGPAPKFTKRALVHADGGACHGSRVVDGKCTGCGIAPDTQSMEFWTLEAIEARAIGGAS